MDAKRKLIRQGAMLFLVGLLTGFIVPQTLNPREALAGHLEGVMNGTFLVAMGCAWSALGLGPVAGRFVYASLSYGAWVNWAATLLGAVLGTNRLTPLAGAGHVGTPQAETLVFGLLVSVGFTMVSAMAIVVWHLWRRPPVTSANAEVV